MSSVLSPLSVGTKVTITKGCEGLGIRKGASATVTSVEELGSDYSNQVRVGLSFVYPLHGSRAGQRDISVYAVHKNRLSDMEPALLGSVSGQRIKVYRC